MTRIYRIKYFFFVKIQNYEGQNDFSFIFRKHNPFMIYLLWVKMKSTTSYSLMFVAYKYVYFRLKNKDFVSNIDKQFINNK